MLFTVFAVVFTMFAVVLMMSLPGFNNEIPEVLKS
jgi:hypothetical protein